MKIPIVRLLVLLLLTIPAAACDLVAGIFKGGVVIGLILAIIIVVVLARLFGGRGKA